VKINSSFEEISTILF